MGLRVQAGGVWRREVALCREGAPKAEFVSSQFTEQGRQEPDRGPHLGPPWAQILLPEGQGFLLCFQEAGLLSFQKVWPLPST